MAFLPDIDLVNVADIQRSAQRNHRAHRPAFAIKRFDRNEDERLHIEDFAQVLNLWPRQRYEGSNYETVARILYALADHAEVDEMVPDSSSTSLSGTVTPTSRTGRLSILMDARRGSHPHTISFLLYMYLPNDTELALNLGGKKTFDEITPATFVRFAEKAGLDTDRVLEVVETQTKAVRRDSWESVRADAPISDDLRGAIDNRVSSVPLLLGA